MNAKTRLKGPVKVSIGGKNNRQALAATSTRKTITASLALIIPVAKGRVWYARHAHPLYGRQSHCGTARCAHKNYTRIISTKILRSGIPFATHSAHTWLAKRPALCQLAYQNDKIIIGAQTFTPSNCLCSCHIKLSLLIFIKCSNAGKMFLVR